MFRTFRGKGVSRQYGVAGSGELKGRKNMLEGGGACVESARSDWATRGAGRGMISLRGACSFLNEQLETYNHQGYYSFPR